MSVEWKKMGIPLERGDLTIPMRYVEIDDRRFGAGAENLTLLGAEIVGVGVIAGRRIPEENRTEIAPEWEDARKLTNADDARAWLEEHGCRPWMAQGLIDDALRELSERCDD